MYPPILVLVLAFASISRQTSALELQEDDGRESDSYSSPYVVNTAGSSATGSLLAYGSTGLVLDEPATVPGDTIVAGASSEIQPPGEEMESVYYQPQHHAEAGASSEEEGRGSYGTDNGFNSSEVGGAGVEQYLTTSAIAMDYALTGSFGSSSTERNDSSEQPPNVFTDNEARASVPQAFVSEQDEDDGVAGKEIPENRMPTYHRVHHEHEEQPVLGSRSLEHHRHHHEQSEDLPSETTNLLFNAADSSGNGNVGNDSSEHPPLVASRSGGENSVEDTQEDDILQLATTTSVPPSSPFAGTSPDQEGTVDFPPGVNPGHHPTKPSTPAGGIDESKLSKPELLAQLITDKNLRMPIAFLVDTLNDSLALSKKVLEASLAPKSPLDAILLRYNSTGISKSVSFRNTKSLMEAVNLLKPSYDRGGSEYYNIMRTSQEIPYDSAIFLATSRATTDAQLSRMTALTLLKKRIRLYVIWFGEELIDTKQQLDQPTTNQTALHELAHKTGGKVIHFEIDRYFGSNPILTTLIADHELHGAHTIPIGVGEGVNSLYFKLHGHVDQATLETPNGTLIDLLDDEESQRAEDGQQRTQPAERTDRKTQRPLLDGDNGMLPLALYRLNRTLPGQYRLRLYSSKASKSYGVTVKSAQHFWYGLEDEQHAGPNLATVQEQWEGEDVEILSNNLGGESKLHTSSSGSSKLPRAIGNGEEHRFARQTELTDEDSGIISGRASIQAITKVDVGVNSQLFGSRGQTLQIFFEVTNYRQTPITYFFRVTDELAFLRSLNPGQATLNPGQSVNVIVTLIVAPTAEIGSRDKVTFSTAGVDQVAQAAWVTVADSSGLADTTRPSLWYTYSSRCEGRSTPATCTGAFWTLEVMARDYETGLMRISSSPAGLIYKTPFTAGTRDEVRASYTASCCQPRVTVTAYDVSRNVRSLNLDVTDIWLNEAGIAAVVLGVLLFIALIILLILLIRYCVRKRRMSKDLPIYRGGESLSTRRTK
uniref:Uncharacterized protein n=1 Tax=Anopheles atroparvus TaxID=41427 RepID=A0A182IZ38_ANOAO